METVLPRAEAPARARAGVAGLRRVAPVPAALGLVAALVVAAFVAAVADLSLELPHLGLLMAGGRVVLLAPGGAAARGGIHVGDTITALDGRSVGVTFSALDAHPAGDLIPLGLGRSGTHRVWWARVTAPSPGELAGDGAALAVALALWLVGLGTGLPRRRERAARLVGLAAFTLALALIALVEQDGAALWPHLLLVPALLCGLGALVLAQIAVAGRSPWLAIALVAIVAGVAAALWLLGLAVALPPFALAWVGVTLVLLAVVAIVGPVALHARPRSEPRRRRLRAALLAGLLGLLPILFWPGLVAAAAVLGRPSAPWAGAGVSPLWSTLGLIPMALLYGALALDENPRRLDALSRIGLSYLAAALYAGALLAMAAAFGGAGAVILVVAALGAFPFLQHAIARLLERGAAPAPPRYDAAQRCIEELAAQSTEPGELAAGVAERLPALLRVRAATLLLKGLDGSDDQYRAISSEGTASDLIRLDASIEARSLAEARPLAPPSQAVAAHAAAGLRHEVSLWSPLWWNDAQRGVLALGPRLADDPFDEADLRQLAVLSGVLALALNGQELIHSLSERATTLVTLTHRLSEAHEQERAHLSRELHDVVAQDLIALTRQLRRYGAENVPPPDIWADMLTAAQDALTATRRICNGLRPAILDLGLLPALRDLVAEAGEREGAPELSLVVEGEEQRLPAELEFALFRVAQEGVNNAVKHSGARQVRLEVCFDEGLRLRLRDDGQGFAVPRGPRDVPGDHLGLIGMRERLAQFGGTLTITSAPGQGAVLDVRVPLNR